MAEGLEGTSHSQCQMDDFTDLTERKVTYLAGLANSKKEESFQIFGDPYGRSILFEQTSENGTWVHRPQKMLIVGAMGAIQEIYSLAWEFLLSMTTIHTKTKTLIGV